MSKKSTTESAKDFELMVWYVLDLSGSVRSVRWSGGTYAPGEIGDFDGSTRQETSSPYQELTNEA
ncbi:MAG: hypothetical protein QGI86_11680 [Candidatus Poribacteria bacterium]|nr:hypothetical protein [Candidatus Poribacteria bacterium]MDP6745455.1 hypothetical protein [Candidatus Poribacteria bacterium]MDP6995583.1 hypothetical protein [Candidatus Poribacteria bacterium]